MDPALEKKLKLSKYEKIALVKAAREEEMAFEGFTFPKNIQAPYDLVLAYVYSLEDMKAFLLECHDQALVQEGGQIYLLYPKLKNPLGHEPIHRDSIFPFLQVEESGYFAGTSYKFNSMVALDANYTLLGAKCQADKKVRSASASSQRGVDYVDKIPDLTAYLKDFPQSLEFYQSLTPGYQKDWARHVYSAKTQATVEKRLAQTQDLLSQGYKSLDLYRQGKR